MRRTLPAVPNRIFSKPARLVRSSAVVSLRLTSDCYNLSIRNLTLTKFLPYRYHSGRQATLLVAVTLDRVGVFRMAADLPRHVMVVDAI